MDTWDRLLPTKMRRRRLLLEFGFRCSCERCSSTVDDLSTLPCPHCAPQAEARTADGLLPASKASGERHPTGLLHFNPNVRSCRSAGSSDGSSGSTAAAMQSPETQSAASEGLPSSRTAVTQLPWTCSSCGVALPDTNEALSGGTSSTMWAEVMEGYRAKASVITPGWDSSSSSGGSSSGGRGNTAVSMVEDAVWVTVYELSSGHPLARKQHLVDAAKLEESFERVVGVINAASSLLGPDHGAVLYARVVLVGMLVGMVWSPVVSGLLVMDMQDSDIDLSALQDSWEWIWAWLDRHPSAAAALVVVESAVFCAKRLLAVGKQQLPTLLTESHRPVLTVMLQLATDLLGFAEPHMQVYSKWPLPIAVYTAYTEARSMLAYAEARALLARLSESSMTQGSTAETSTAETGAADASAAVTSRLQAAGTSVAEASAAVTSAAGTGDGRAAAEAPEGPAGDSHDEFDAGQHSMPAQRSGQAAASFQKPGKSAEPVEDPVHSTANITHKSACQRGSAGSVGYKLQIHSTAVVIAAVAAAAIMAGCGWVYGHVF